jgi:putative FmdB family regulatory protein
MPMFEYKCNKCEHRTEFLEKRAGRTKHVCEKCGSSDMQKLFSSFSVGQSNQGRNSCPTGTCVLS